MSPRQAVSFLTLSVVGMILAVLCFGEATAHASGQDLGEETVNPTVVAPFQPSHWNGKVNLLLCGDTEVMNARRVIEGVASRLTMLHIKVDKKPYCMSKHPARWVIVKIDGNLTDGYWGETWRWSDACNISLAPQWGSDPFVPAHEFLHCLGMDHHTAPGGIMSVPTPSMKPISDTEWAALLAVYTWHYVPTSHWLRHPAKR